MSQALLPCGNQSKGHTVTVVALTVGNGASTAVFSVVNAILLVALQTNTDFFKVFDVPPRRGREAAEPIALEVVR